MAELEQLAYAIADEDAAATIECNCACAARRDAGGFWWDLSSVDDVAKHGVDRAARYLELRGSLDRHPDTPHLVFPHLEVHHA